MKYLSKLVLACLLLILSGQVNSGETKELVVAQSDQPKLKYTSELHWYVTHACSTEATPSLRKENTPINIRFFEVLNGERTRETWPDNKEHVYILRGHSVFKNTKSIRVDCAYPTQVCYGAELDDEKSTGQWGVGIDGQDECNSCCYSCPRGGWNDVRIELNCN